MTVQTDNLEKIDLEDIPWLRLFADKLNEAKRIHLGEYGEGTKVIQMSDELAIEVSERLYNVAKVLNKVNECEFN
ncbi:hypothetical protein D3C81_2197610 [compost metagenome]